MSPTLNEVIGELGFSLENTLFGGVAKGFVEWSEDIGDMGLPVAGIFQIPWNTIIYEGYNNLPTLTPEPPRFRIMEITPIPVHFFIDLYKPEYWSHHVRRFGSGATHMGYRVAGTRMYPDKDGKFTGSRFFHPYSPRSFETIKIDKKTMHPVEIGAAELENQRRRRALRIVDQFYEHQKNLEAIKEAQAKVSLVQPMTDADENEVLKGREFCCPRYNEIQHYLLDNRFELALDTMTFVVPENTLFRYVMEQGGLDVTADEFRDFLFVCGFKSNLFRYNTAGCGVVHRLDNGWPPLPKSGPEIQSKPPIKPTKEYLLCFKLVSREIIHRDHIFVHHFMDHDFEDFKKRWNQYYTSHKEFRVDSRMKGQPLMKFPDWLFYACLWYCNQEGDFLVFGPKGVIRWMFTYPDKKGVMKKLTKKNEAPKPDKTVEDKCKTM